MSGVDRGNLIFSTGTTYSYEAVPRFALTAIYYHFLGTTRTGTGGSQGFTTGSQAFAGSNWLGGDHTRRYRVAVWSCLLEIDQQQVDGVDPLNDFLLN